MLVFEGVVVEVGVSVGVWVGVSVSVSDVVGVFVGVSVTVSDGVVVGEIGRASCRERVCQYV